jgi:hypothetical protein
MKAEPQMSIAYSQSPREGRSVNAPPRPPYDPALLRSGRTKHNRACPVCKCDDSQCIALPGKDIREHLSDEADRAEAEGEHAEAQRKRAEAAAWHPERDYVWCIRGEGQDGGQRVTWGFRGDIWFFDQGESGAARQLAPVRREAPIADAETIDRILRGVVSAFGLSDAHRQQLVTQRGYTADSIGPDARHVFATLPAAAAVRVGVVVRLLASDPLASQAAILGTYGFRRDRRRGGDNAPIAFLPDVEGAALLELVQDERGQLVGFEVAPDTPPRDNKGKPLKRIGPARMTKSGRYHVGRPARDQEREVWHAEAIHKANLTADAREAPALGSLGAGNTSGLVAGALALDPQTRRLHVLALDTDQWGGPHERELARRLYRIGYRVALARWDAAKGKGPDDAIAASATITLQPYTDDQPQPRRDQRMPRVYPWQRGEETPEERAALLNAASARIAEQVAAHLDASASDPDTRRTTLVMAGPPGVGKTHSVAELGAASTAHPNGLYDLAWIAGRRDMAYSVPALAHGYRHIEPATAHNCPDYQLHDVLGALGYNTRAVHSQHYVGGACAYSGQFQAQGSAVYQLPHVRTGYPAEHQAIVIDELDLAQWLPERQVTIGKLHAAQTVQPYESAADRLLRALQATITEAARSETRLQGRTLFDALDAQCGDGGGWLAAWLGTIGQDKHAITLRPWVDVDPNDPDALAHVSRLTPVVLPHVWHALAGELVQWQRGGDWNSRVRIGPATVSGEWALHITEPLQFGESDEHPGNLPPRVVLDATADEELLALLFDGAPVRIERAEVPPPPHTRHVAVRTGKRYGKVSQATGRHHERDLARTIAECRYLLADLDPDGAERAAERVGLITYKGCECELAEALGIPEHRSGHFWGVRGSNDFETCTILLVIGTPALSPHDLARLARALWHRDPTPIDENCDETADVRRYCDPRLQRLAEYLSHAELTQCAHRNRPLRYDGRTVVTLCAGVVDFLPITMEVTSLPQLAADGTPRTTRRQEAAEERLRHAADELLARGEVVNRRTLAAAAHIRAEVALEWLRASHSQDGEAIAPMVPKTHIESICKTGTTLQIPPSCDDPPATSPPEAPEPPPHPPIPLRPRLPIWADALRVAGMGASQGEVMREWRRMLTT